MILKAIQLNNIIIIKESRFVDLIDKKFTGEKRKEDIKHTYYQPVNYIDSYKTIGYIPKGLNATNFFQSMEDCEKWLKDHHYNIKDWNIEEYDDDDRDSRKMIIIDSEGNPIE